MLYFKAIIAVIGTWFVGMSSLAALWTRDTALLALLILPTIIIAALLVTFFIVRATWRHDALSVVRRGAQPAIADDRSDDLDDALAQSFPASDPPASTTGIARVRPVPAA